MASAARDIFFRLGAVLPEQFTDFRSKMTFVLPRLLCRISLLRRVEDYSETDEARHTSYDAMYFLVHCEHRPISRHT